MKNEADFKKVFKKSIKEARGYSISLAAPMLAGIPDLYVILPNYIPLLLEAKWLGEIKNTRFDRKIPFSKLQELYLSEINRVNPYTAFGLIGFKYENDIHAVLTSFHTNRINNNFKTTLPHTIYNKQTKTFDVMDMLKQSKVPEINYYQKHTLTMNHKYATEGNVQL